ncbi:MAG: DUF3179 domain-containing (seleno)protein [Lentilitoribacter sp.]
MAISSKPHLYVFHAMLAVCALLINTAHAEERKALPDYVIEKFGEPPAIPDGELSDEVKAAVKVAFIDAMEKSSWDRDQSVALITISQSKDPRLVWILSDLMRFSSGQRLNIELSAASTNLLGKEIPLQNQWGVATDHLIAWDIPEPPNYLEYKRAIFTTIVPGWERIFVEGDIDWRHVSWGGVLIDNRPYDTTDEPCNCIPAADNPEVSSAEDAVWLKDDDVIFGVEVNGEYRAYPRRIMEVREMVNDTLGGRHLGIPYCTLCGAAQAYFTDQLPEGIERPVLRTSGLLIRSNKVMYDLTTYSVLDTFKGNAVTGPLFEKGITLKQASVVTSTWGAWKKAHPETTVLLEKYALGRDPDFRNGRDANGPIFPVGNVDPRLPVHEDIIGVITEAGQPIAFQRSNAVAALASGKEITFGDVSLVLSGSGVKAVGKDGADIGSHQAFWFAWSQFHPETELWVGS